MRKLASVQRILDIKPIPDADVIEVATVEGWEVVVGKGQHQVGDLCVYFEIDSMLPLDKFPEIVKYNPRGRIKTVKLRGQISQGFVIGLNTLFEKYPNTSKEFLNEGDDLTEVLGVVKYEPSASFSTGLPAGSFPYYIIARTDEDRIQSNRKYFQIFNQQPFVATIKYDGTSATFGWDEDKFFAASHNLKRYDTPDCVYWKMARKYNLEAFPREIVIQGEICGPGIQKNRLDLKEFDLFVFIIYDQNNKRYFTYDERVEFCNIYGLKHVDLALRGNWFDFTTVNQLQDLTDRKYFNTRNQIEGLVFELDNFINKRCSFKVISNKYLLKGD